MVRMGGHVHCHSATAKVGIIISLTLNKWLSRERESEVDNENGMKARGGVKKVLDYKRDAETFTLRICVQFSN